MPENIDTNSPEVSPPDEALNHPTRSTLIPRVIVSIVVAGIVAGLLSVGGYFLINAIENKVLEISLLVIMYIVGLVVGVLLRLAAGNMKLIDLFMFLIFGVVFTVIGFQYASGAIALGVKFLPWA